MCAPFLLSLLSASLLGGAELSAGRLIPNPTPMIVPSASGRFAVAGAPFDVAPKKSPFRFRFRLIQVGKTAELRFLWSGSADYWPGRILVSDDARVATVDEWGGVAANHAVTLFDDQGRVLAAYSLESIFPPSEARAIPASPIDGPLNWWKSAEFRVAPREIARRMKTPGKRPFNGVPLLPGDPQVLAIRIYDDTMLWFDPSTGKRIMP